MSALFSPRAFAPIDDGRKPTKSPSAPLDSNKAGEISTRPVVQSASDPATLNDISNAVPIDMHTANRVERVAPQKLREKADEEYWLDSGTTGGARSVYSSREDMNGASAVDYYSGLKPASTGDNLSVQPSLTKRSLGILLGSGEEPLSDIRTLNHRFRDGKPIERNGPKVRLAFDMNVHKGIADNAFRLVPGLHSAPDVLYPHLDQRWIRLIEGVIWPDVPEPDLNDESTAPWKSLLYAKLWKTPGTLAYETHYGSKQFWHSMADGKHTNQQIVEKIIDQSRIWYERGQRTRDTFHIGKLLHMVQDSYSAAHVARTNCTIDFFQSYAEQDTRKHSQVDKAGASGIIDARDASVKVLQLYAEGASFDKVEEFLRNYVYRLSSGAADRIAGGTKEKYRKD